jgi:hypothetical protein
MGESRRPVSRYMAMKASPAFRSWSGRLAAWDRTTFSALVESLLVAHAARTGFPEPPPPRFGAVSTVDSHKSTNGVNHDTDSR